MKKQLELGLGKHPGPALRFRRRVSRARWWFEQMRQVVDRAVDYPPADSQPAQGGAAGAATGRGTPWN